MASKTWVLPLKDFKPTSKNYSVFDKDSCIVCQDYSEIDDFAKAVTLSKLQPLYNADHSVDHDPDGSYNAKQFDATKLLRALSIINEPVDKALAGIVKKYFKLEDTKGGTLKDLFSLYAAFPIRTLDELGNDSTIFASEKTKLQGRLRIARSSGDQPMEDSISAEIKRLQETYDDKLKIYNWLYLPGDQRTKLVQAVAPALWSSLTGHKEREKGYKTTRNGGMDDRVLKARLVYTWLAYSISYDNELKDDVDRLQQDRSVADMLISGREVCAGYANLFTEMFNSLLDSDPANAAKMAETVSGLSRQLGGLQYKSDPTEVKFGHAWNVFPTHLSSTSDTDYKVIDPCWAAARDGVHSDPSWWAMSNASFTMSHVPWNVEHCHAALSHADMKTLWNVPQPRLAGEGFPHLEWIDKSTIQPLEPGVTPAGDMREVYVSFRNNCKHQGPKMQGFHLGFKHSVDSMTLFLAREFSEDVSSDFKRFATKSNRSRRSGARNLRFRRILRASGPSSTHKELSSLSNYPSIPWNPTLYRPIEEEDSFDGREQALLNYIHTHPSLPTLRNNHRAILDAIDEFGRTKDLLMTLGPAKREIIDNLLASQRPRIILDMGAYVGYSALMLGAALLDLYPDEDQTMDPS